MAGLKLKALKKSYGSVDVIHGVDLEIKQGEFNESVHEDHAGVAQSSGEFFLAWGDPSKVVMPGS